MVLAYAVFLRTDGAATSDVPARKHNSIKTYLGAISATCAEFNCPNPPQTKDPDLKRKLAEWKDTDDVQQAEPFDFVADLPRLWAACWTMKQWSQNRALKVWTMLLVSICMFARADDITSHCPLIEDCRLPPAGLWDADGLPHYIEVCMRDWKWRKRANAGKPYYMRLWRNYRDARFCPVYWLTTYLRYYKLRKGPIFQFKEKVMSPEQWETATDALFKKAGLYVAKHYDEELRCVVPGKGCTNHSIRRSAAQWAGRCDGREVDVRNGGRWRTMKEMAHYMAQGAYMSVQAREAAGTGRDPILDMWCFQPVCISGPRGGKMTCDFFLIHAEI